MISIKTPEEIRIMTKGGRILAGIIKELEKQVKPGVTTKELDKLAENLILKSGAKCSFKGYEGFPDCLCVSVNEQIVHGVPSNQVLKEGDIISLDLGLRYEGYHSDMATTVPVGKVKPEILRLIRVTKKALKMGIKKTKSGNTLGDIGRVIQNYVESQGFNVVRELCGHGIGKELHEDPKILNYSKPYSSLSGFKIKEGMVFCIEPMVTMGDWRIKKGKDGHVYQTIDGSLSAHFEAQVAVVQNGNKILTPIP